MDFGYIESTYILQMNSLNKDRHYDEVRFIET